MERNDTTAARAERVADRAASALTQGRLPLDESAEAAARARGPKWSRLFAGGSPREVLSRLVPGDPLGVRQRLARVLTDEALLVDADRAHLRALARCARAAMRYHGKPEIDEWVDERVREALTEIVREDAEAARSSAPPDAGSAFEALARPLGLDPAHMRSACAAFNCLPIDERRAFFDWVVRGRALDRLAAEARTNASEIARRARRALDVLRTREK